MTTRYDIAIAGAGPAGAAIARRLAQAGFRVVMLERSLFDKPRVGESLAPAVQPLLKELGLWQEFLDTQPLPSYGTRSAWGAPVAEEHSHLMTPYLCGWHVDRLAFDRMLAASAVRAGADLRSGTEVLRCTFDTNGSANLNVVSGSRSDELRADFVIDASGRGSMVARRLGARAVIFDRLVGIAAQFENTRAGTRCYTLVETTRDGWWYSAPAAINGSVTMLMTDGDLASKQRAKEFPSWRAALSQAALTSASIDGCEVKWGPRLFSAVSQRVVRERNDRRRWFAAGDAALAVDPVSGSGVVRALRGAQSAASTVLSTLSGDASAIASYEAERDEECTKYLMERVAYYQMEKRWPDAPFWKRRIKPRYTKTQNINHQ